MPENTVQRTQAGLLQHILERVSLVERRQARRYKSPPEPLPLTADTYTALPTLTAADAGHLMTTSNNGRLYRWTGTAWAYVTGPSETIYHAEQGEQSVAAGGSGARYKPSVVLTETTRVRVTSHAGMFVTANAAMDMRPWINGYQAVGSGGSAVTVHSNARGNMIWPFTYAYEWSLAPGTHQIGFGYNVHTGSSSSVITTSTQIIIERIPD